MINAASCLQVLEVDSVHRRHVAPSDLEAENELVDRACQMRLDQKTVENRLSQHTPDKAKVIQVMGLMLRRRVHLPNDSNHIHNQVLRSPHITHM